MPKVFVDTNILVYMFDFSDKVKQRISAGRFLALADEGNGVISTQVLQEFFVSAVKKLSMDPLDVKQVLAKFSNFEIITPDLELIHDAIDCSILNRLSFWDALIIASAHRAGCGLLLTEDLNHGQIIKGVKVEHIFK